MGFGVGWDDWLHEGSDGAARRVGLLPCLFSLLIPLLPSRSPPRPQAFSSWIHICAVRLFVESILRYGLPPQVGRAAASWTGAAERLPVVQRRCSGLPVTVACTAGRLQCCYRCGPSFSSHPCTPVCFTYAPQFLSVLMRPNPKTTGRLRKVGHRADAPSLPCPALIGSRTAPVLMPRPHPSPPQPLGTLGTEGLATMNRCTVHS